MMGNSKDIYNEEKQEQEGRASRPDRRPRSAEKHKKRKWRKALLSILALGVATYASYCGFVAVKGFLDYKGISLGETSIQSLLSPRESSNYENSLGRDQESRPDQDSRMQLLVDKASQTESLQKDIINLINKGLAAQAISRMRNADNPLNTSRIRELLADAHMMEENYAAAIENYEQLLKRDPENLDARLKIAEALFERKRFEESKVAAEWALDLDPDSTQALNIAADCHMETGEIEDAIKLYREILARNPDNEETHSKLAMAYYESGEHGRAVRYLEKTVREGTESSLVYYNLAACYAKQEIAEKTIETLKRAGEKFGSSFVRTWIQGEDFSKLRNDPKFRIFAAKLSKKPDVASLKVKSDKKSISAELETSPIQLDKGTDRLINRDR